MVKVTVTTADLDAAKKAGACGSTYKSGTAIADVKQSDLIWAEENMPERANKAAAALAAEHGIVGVPALALFAASGYGSGYGDGYGSGYGYGYGDGYGYGSGYGYGYGYGDGSGYGYGSGSGSGSGYGYGYGDGSGDGDGHGSG